MKHGHHVGHPGPSASHGRPATIRDLPPHLLAARVAAHLSAADAARLMQAAGTDHRDELKHVMDAKKKEAVGRAAEEIVRVMRDVTRSGRGYKIIPAGKFQGVDMGVFLREGDAAPGPLIHSFGGNPKRVAHMSVFLSGVVKNAVSTRHDYVATLQFGDRLLDPFPAETRRAAPTMAFAFIDDEWWKKAGKNPEAVVELFRDITRRWSGGMDVVVVEKHGRENTNAAGFDAHISKHPGKIVLWVKRTKSK